MGIQGCFFDIKRYAIHDGPGIRISVFFKGCPLSCRWCHNPESQDPVPQVMFDPLRCIGCGACRGHTIPDLCPSTALEVCGWKMDIGQIMQIVLKERLFFERSGGGVTFTGGEPLMQPEILAELLEACRGNGIHTALDSSLWAPAHIVKKIIPLTGLVLADIKVMDPAKHKYYTGVDNALIHSNLMAVARSGVPFALRIPLVRGINDSGRETEDLIAFALRLRDAGNLTCIHLLPFHPYGKNKASGLISGKIPASGDFSAPAAHAVDSLLIKMLSMGFNVVKGG